MAEWISVKERMPETEIEVIVFANRDGFSIITTAMYENGKVNTEESMWGWYDLDFDYDEENDVYLIPEGWWEYKHFNQDEYNYSIDVPVTHWMPLPVPPENE